MTQKITLNKMIKLPVMSFDKYILRPVKEEDAYDYFEIGKDEETVKYLSWYAFKNVSEAFTHFNYLYFSENFSNDPQGYAIVDVETNKMIGVIDFHTFNKVLKTAHIGYLLHKDYWGLGIITESLRLMTEVGFEHLNLRKIYIKSIKENLASRRVCEKNNFKLTNIRKIDYYHKKTNTYHYVYKYVLERKSYYDSKTNRNL